MALLERLAVLRDADEGVDSIGLFTFIAALRELNDGAVTLSSIHSFFNLDAGEQSELGWLIGKAQALPTDEEKTAFLDFIQRIFILAEARAQNYTTNQSLVDRINSQYP